jgi:hypothetical protein
LFTAPTPNTVDKEELMMISYDLDRLVFDHAPKASGPTPIRPRRCAA